MRIPVILSYIIFSATGSALAQNAYVNLGRQAFMDGDFRTAVAHLEKACVVDSTNADALWMLGYSYYHNESYKKAVVTYSRVIAIKPGDDRAYYYCARAYTYLAKDIHASAADKEKALYNAIFDFTHSININPNDMKVYQNRAIAYREYGVFKLQSSKPADRTRGINSLKASVADFEKVLSVDGSRSDIETLLAISKDKLAGATAPVTAVANHR